MEFLVFFLAIASRTPPPFSRFDSRGFTKLNQNAPFVREELLPQSPFLLSPPFFQPPWPGNKSTVHQRIHGFHLGLCLVFGTFLSFSLLGEPTFAWIGAHRIPSHGEGLAPITFFIPIQGTSSELVRKSPHESEIRLTPPPEQFSTYRWFVDTFGE